MNRKHFVLLTIIAAAAIILAAIGVILAVVSLGLKGTSANGFTTTPASVLEQGAQDYVDSQPLSPYETACNKADEYRSWATLAKDEKQRLYYKFKADAYGNMCQDGE